jgi:hypothetical protein
MSATTTEGTGPGAVDRYIPRLYNNQVRIENIVVSKEETLPGRIDGGELKAMVSALTEEEKNIIIEAANILKRIGKQF